MADCRRRSAGNGSCTASPRARRSRPALSRWTMKIDQSSTMTPKRKRPNPVVLIHGAWAGAWVWDPLLPYLKIASLDCVALDLPGNGSDGLDPASIDLETCLTHVHDEVLKLAAPVSLIVHSGGGNIASAFAERWP